MPSALMMCRVSLFLDTIVMRLVVMLVTLNGQSVSAAAERYQDGRRLRGGCARGRGPVGGAVGTRCRYFLAAGFFLSCFGFMLFLSFFCELLPLPMLTLPRVCDGNWQIASLDRLFNRQNPRLHSVWWSGFCSPSRPLLLLALDVSIAVKVCLDVQALGVAANGQSRRSADADLQ